MKYRLVLRQDGVDREFNTNEWSAVRAIALFAGYKHAIEDYGKEVRRLQSGRSRLAEIHFQMEPCRNRLAIYNTLKKNNTTAFGAAV